MENGLERERKKMENDLDQPSTSMIMGFDR
jgi:hypothetical protein